ncbi:monovalent cation/H(+) antiporter subunit G [Desulfuromonas sp. TF]|jgi:multicomponent Na+:H+ antiporter subunit G|uniref:monovalent cation/H(+) antiporter subunit G n=1 Tax=Desulfuromonas sp. TF TaxID=1232410 RepID=UPI0003FAFAA8|nr:monovalent cation/H(+) antiporter subunit G [Desulfuromonas sp. TF]
MSEIVVAALLVFGAAFILVAAIGLVRMPDIFLRMSCNAKASTLGIGLLLLGLAVHFGEMDVSGRALATIGFIVLTTPIASHRIGRVAYLDGTPLWEGTIADEMRGKYASGEVMAERKKE